MVLFASLLLLQLQNIPYSVSSAPDVLPPLPDIEFVVMGPGGQNPVAAALTQQFDKTRAALMQGYLQGSPNEKIWLREGDGRTQIVIRALKRDDVAGDVRLKGVSLFVYTLNKQGVLDFSRRIEADQALLSHGEWKLKGVKEATPGAEALHYDSLAIPSTLTISLAASSLPVPLRTILPFSNT